MPQLDLRATSEPPLASAVRPLHQKSARFSFRSLSSLRYNKGKRLLLTQARAVCIPSDLQARPLELPAGEMNNALKPLCPQRLCDL